MNTKIALVMLGFVMIPVTSLAVASDPSSFLKKTSAAFDKLDTYAAEGTVITEIESDKGRNRLETSFSMKLKKPNKYLITWKQNSSTAPTFPQSGAVWNDGTDRCLYISAAKAFYKMRSDEEALFGAGGLFGGVAPSLFFKHSNVDFTRLVDLKLLADEHIEGDDCYVIIGTTAHSEPVKLWISKTSYLIRQYTFGPVETKPPELTDEQLENAIKATGKEVTPEQKEDMRKMINRVNEMTENTKYKETLTETYKMISTPPLIDADFKFDLPEGTSLRPWWGPNGRASR